MSSPKDAFITIIKIIIIIIDQTRKTQFNVRWNVHFQIQLIMIDTFILIWSLCMSFTKLFCNVTFLTDNYLCMQVFKIARVKHYFLFSLILPKSIMHTICRFLSIKLWFCSPVIVDWLAVLGFIWVRRWWCTRSTSIIMWWNTNTHNKSTIENYLCRLYVHVCVCKCKCKCVYVCMCRSNAYILGQSRNCRRAAQWMRMEMWICVYR